MYAHTLSHTVQNTNNGGTNPAMITGNICIIISQAHAGNRQSHIFFPLIKQKLGHINIFYIISCP